MPDRILADLHVHTTYSDSTFTPAEVVDRAAWLGLNVVAITDHDTIDGVDEARREASGRGIEIVAGVEISAYHGSEEFHIIGLYVDNSNSEFVERINLMNRARLERIHEIVDRLKGMGVELAADDVMELSHGSSPGRLHVAQALLNHGYVSALPEAFARYLGDRCGGFVPKRYMTVQESIEAVRSAGGVSILAHPGLTNRDEYIPRFREMGLDGLEAFYPAYSEFDQNRYLTIVNREGMLASGGSDCHGKRRTDIMLGRVLVPEPYVRKIKQAVASIHESGKDSEEIL